MENYKVKKKMCQSSYGYWLSTGVKGIRDIPEYFKISDIIDTYALSNFHLCPFPLHLLITV